MKGGAGPPPTIFLTIYPAGHRWAFTWEGWQPSGQPIPIFPFLPLFLGWLQGQAELALNYPDKIQSPGEVLEVEDFNKAKPLNPVAASLSSQLPQLCQKSHLLTCRNHSPGGLCLPDRGPPYQGKPSPPFICLPSLSASIQPHKRQ